MVQPTNSSKNTTAPADEHKQETKPGVGVESIENVGTKGPEIPPLPVEDQKDVEGDYVVGDKVEVVKDSMVQKLVYKIDKIGKPNEGEATYILKDVESNELYDNGQPVKDSDLKKWEPKETKQWWAYSPHS